MKRVLITGIAGFIGFHLALHLKKRGDFVMGCDNFNPYYDPSLKRTRAKLLKEAGIEVFESNIQNPNLLEQWIVDQGITHFVHLAAQAGVRHSLHHPESYVASNLDGFVQVLEVCRRHPQIPFIYASSSSVYGLNQKVPFSEHDVTDKPASLYGATKKANELIAHAYHHLFGMRVTGLRYFTVYGPWGRPDMAYYAFTGAILRGETIPVYAEGKLQRDFTYIDDIVAGTAAAIDLAAPCEIFNLGNNHPEEVLSLIACIEEATGKQANISWLPMQPGDVKTTYADISKSERLLGFKPKTSLKTGIEQFVKWYQAYFVQPN
jgi:UDP-glucuronate 4-epimerase